MYLNPENMPRDYQARIARWLAANGCRDMIALEPITVRGKVAEYQAICRKHKMGRRWDNKPGGIQFTPDLTRLTTTTRRLRIRIPLQDVA